MCHNYLIQRNTAIRTQNFNMSWILDAQNLSPNALQTDIDAPQFSTFEKDHALNKITHLIFGCTGKRRDYLYQNEPITPFGSGDIKRGSSSTSI